MNTVQIEYFIELCETLNYSRAAENLDISQPTLSKAVRHLENELGFSLFEKNGRTISMTKEARTFLPYARQAVEILDQAVKEARDQKRTIHIGCISSVQIDYLPQLINAYSKIRNVHFKITTGVSSDLLTALETHQIDVAICTAPHHNKEIEHFPIIQQALMLCVPANHRYANLDAVTIDMIQDDHLISHDANSVMRKRVKLLFDSCHIKPHIVAEAEEDNSIISLVRTGIGVGIVSNSRNLITDGVVLIPIRQNVVQRNVSLCYRKNDLRNQHFISFIQAHPSFHTQKSSRREI